MWAMGILLYIMLTGKHPFKHKTEQDLFSRIIVGEITPNTNICFDAMRLINNLLKQDPNRRPSASEVASDAWLFANDALGASVKFIK